MKKIALAASLAITALSAAPASATVLYTFDQARTGFYATFQGPALVVGPNSGSTDTCSSASCARFDFSVTGGFGDLIFTDSTGATNYGDHIFPDGDVLASYGTFTSFDGSILTVSSVPEAATWAIMLFGLLIISAINRFWPQCVFRARITT